MLASLFTFLITEMYFLGIEVKIFAEQFNFGNEGKPLKYKKFSCSVCSYTSFQMGDLKKHIRVHTGDRPFICNTCGRTFRQISHLRCHENKVHFPLKT